MSKIKSFIFIVMVIVSFISCVSQKHLNQPVDKEWASDWLNLNAPYAVVIYDSTIFNEVRTIIASEPYLKPGAGVGFGRGRDFVVFDRNSQLAE